MKLQVSGLSRIKLSKESYWLIGALLVLVACIGPLRGLQKNLSQPIRLNEQLMHVQAMAQEAAKLKAQQASFAAAMPVALHVLVEQRLGGKAAVVRTGDTAVVSLSGVPTEQLSGALAAMRQEAAAQILQMQLRVVGGVLHGRIELHLPEVR